MTEPEWAIVALAFTELFDTVKAIAPDKVHIDKTYAAGKILQKELDRIRAKRSLFTDLITDSMPNIGYRFKTTVGYRQQDWRKRNEELEKKKEAQRAQELGDLTQALKLSIEKAEKDRQGE